MCNLTVCDRRSGAVLEITPKNIVVRQPREGIGACTNHFRTKELATSLVCPRYAILEKSRELKALGVKEVAQQLHAVNQGKMTLQTMVFEPAALRLHLAFGKGPATALPLAPLELAPLFKAE
jgi:isopenicillin-N N-acyltransferase-like protein